MPGLDLALKAIQSGIVQSTDRRARLAKLAQAQAAQQAATASSYGSPSLPGGIAANGVAGPGKTVNSITGKVNLSKINFAKGSTLINSQYANQFQGLINDLQRAGYRIDTGLGYQNRNVAGTNTPSKHAGGYAIDINPSKNPFSTSGKTEFNKNVLHQIMSKYPDLIWGGDWKGAKKDSMHFSVRHKIPGYSTY